MTQTKRRVLRCVCFALLFVLLLGAVQTVLRMKWTYENGLLISDWQQEYVQEPAHTVDVLVVGSSHAYTSFDPIQLWRESGVTSFVLGSPDQTVPSGLYLLRRGLKTQQPKIVLYEVFGTTYYSRTTETNLHQLVDGVPLSPEKLRAVEALRRQDDDLFTLMLPLVRFHERWKEVDGFDFAYLFTRYADTRCLKGFEPRSRVCPDVTLAHYNDPAPEDATLSPENVQALDELVALCREQGITLVFWKAPAEKWRRENAVQVQAYADANGIPFIDFNTMPGEIGLDSAADFDDENHLNYRGAQKVTGWFTTLLTTEYNLPDRRADAELAALWEKDVAFWKENIPTLQGA